MSPLSLILIFGEKVPMELTKKEAFIKQIVIYMNGQDYDKAYELCQGFVKKFPGEMVSHFLQARSAFALKRFDETKIEARKAFSMSTNKEDMLASALLASTAHLELKEYANGYELLRRMEEKKDSSDLQSAMVVFSLALRDKQEVVKHLDKLYALNERLAMAMAARIVNSA
jgi:tetratricopeptide (TPR) repeat protein